LLTLNLKMIGRLISQNHTRLFINKKQIIKEILSNWISK